MTPQDTVNLMRLVTQCSPAMKLAEGTPAVWHRILGDLEFTAACDGVLAFYATERRFITPADIRERVASAAGLLSPDEDEAWRAAVKVAGNEGVGRLSLPLAVQEAYDTVGGSGSIRMEQGTTMRAQFRDAYRSARDRYDRRVLSAPLALTAPEQRREVSA